MFTLLKLVLSISLNRLNDWKFQIKIKYFCNRRILVIGMYFDWWFFFPIHSMDVFCCWVILFPPPVLIRVKLFCMALGASIDVHQPWANEHLKNCNNISIYRRKIENVKSVDSTHGSINNIYIPHPMDARLNH